ncbi:MAG: hypothetical protein AB1806_16085 [Acidobacteriota bacterium]
MLMNVRSLLALTLAATLAGSVACGARPDEGDIPVIWAAPEGYKIAKSGRRIFVQDTGQDLTAIKRANRLWDSAAGRITVQGARGETVAFQLGIEGGGAGRRRVDVRTSALSSRDGHAVPASRVDLFKIYYTEVDDRGSGPTNGPSMGPGWYPDALVPWSIGDTHTYGGYDGPPFAIQPGEIQGVWVDLTIPYGTPAGDYTGSLTVDWDTQQSVLHFVLHVLDIDIPRKIHSTFFMNFDLDDLNQAGGRWLSGDRLAAYEDEVYRLARRHRFTAGNMYGADGPAIEETPSGDIGRVDWTAYDAAHDKVLNPKNNLFGPGEDAIEIWKVPLSTGIDSTGPRLPAGDRAWDQMVVEIVRHWRERGWDLSRAYAYLADEPEASAAADLDDFARRVKHASGGALRRQIAVYTVLGGRWDAQQPVFDWWKDALDMWLVAGDYYSVRHMNALPADALKGMYQGGEPYQGNETLDADGVALRTWSWIAWQYRIDYLCYYSMSEAWRRAVPSPDDPGRFVVPPGPDGENNDNEIWDHPRNRTWALSQGVFIYPGKKVDFNLPIANIRMKQIRRGQTDYEYFWLLQQAGEGALADRLVKSVLKLALSDAAAAPERYGAGRWSHDPADWDAALAAAAARLEQVKERLPREPASVVRVP